MERKNRNIMTESKIMGDIITTRTDYQGMRTASLPTLLKLIMSSLIFQLFALGFLISWCKPLKNI